MSATIASTGSTGDKSDRASSRLLVHPEESINKIGHALAVLDPVFRRYTLEDERIKQVAKDLKYHKDPKVLQSMVICKQPRIGGEVPVHNDSTFLYTDPPSAVGAWVALEECTAQNGCLVSIFNIKTAWSRSNAIRHAYIRPVTTRKSADTYSHSYLDPTKLPGYIPDSSAPIKEGRHLYPSPVSRRTKRSGKMNRDGSRRQSLQAHWS